MEHYGFFNGEQEYGQDEFCRYFDKIYESGVSIEDNSLMSLGVTKSITGIDIAKGFSIIKGFYLYNDSVKAISIIRDSNYSRIDRVVIRLNLSNKTVSISLKQGTPSSTPQVPILQRDNLMYELSLAQLRVPREGDITVIDERSRQELCGAIRPKNLTEFNSMLKNFTAEFDRWFNSQQSKGWRNVFIQKEKPSESVSGSIWLEIL